LPSINNEAVDKLFEGSMSHPSIRPDLNKK
jgi:hypothetical protein